MVAPNSPRARAQHSTAPAMNDGMTMGTVTVRNTRKRPAPRLRAASSSRPSVERNASRDASVLTTSQADDHGARHSSPASGSANNAAPTAAIATGTSGGRSGTPSRLVLRSACMSGRGDLDDHVRGLDDGHGHHT